MTKSLTNKKLLTCELFNFEKLESKEIGKLDVLFCNLLVTMSGAFRFRFYSLRLCLFLSLRHCCEIRAALSSVHCIQTQCIRLRRQHACRKEPLLPSRLYTVDEENT